MNTSTFRNLLIILGLLCSTFGFAQNRKEIFNNYIKQYSGLAVEEMKKYKIPASITLAQGLLESSAGQSKLARKGNNHFGIKCGSDWKGPSIREHDDRRNERFRKYKNAKESYEDHSKFLAGRSRYKGLFKLKITDYKGWAHGLKKAGYATDKKYPQKLISIIEEYKLYEYDKASSKSNRKSKGSDVINAHQVYVTNDIPFIVISSGDTFDQLKKEFEISKKKILKYNDLPSDYQLTTNDIIFLKKKKKKASKANKIHIVARNESLHLISQKYGIRLDKLYKMNKKQLANNRSMKVGDTIKLR